MVDLHCETGLKYFIILCLVIVFTSNKCVEYLKEFGPTILIDSYCVITFSGMTSNSILIFDSLFLQDLERIFNENGGIREKEPFFLSHVDDYNEVFLRSFHVIVSGGTNVLFSRICDGNFLLLSDRIGILTKYKYLLV